MKFSVVVAIALSLLGLVPVFGQSDFTYQGSLQENNSPANGAYDLSFSLYTAVTDGTRVGLINYRYDVPVTNGLFLVSLDFGTSAFETSAARWLEIGARPAGGSNSFTTLTPRQKVSFTPRAVYAASSPASGLIGSLSSGSIGSGSITSDKLAADSVTVEKLAQTSFFAISATGELHVNGISTNDPGQLFPGTMTITGIQPPIPVSSNLVILEMPRVQLELDSFNALTGYRTVSPFKVRRLLGADDTWGRWMNMDTANPQLGSITLTLPGTTGNREAVLLDAFPIHYQIERGHDGFFYETFGIKANRLEFH